MRASRVTRNTSETKIQLELCLDGSGKSEIKSGCGFLDHMLTAFARHGRFDIILSCDGDLEVIIIIQPRISVFVSEKLFPRRLEI